MANTNTSATGGFLAPLAASVPDDAALDALLQTMVAGVTGIDGTLVRPRWQPTDPKQPERTVDWCAIGVMNITTDTNAVVLHQSYADINDPNTCDQLQRHEMLDVMASFYGPNSYGNAALLRDGLAISQNRETLFLAGIAYANVQPIVAASELINNLWVRRADITINFRRVVVRTYAIENILSAPGTAQDDNGLSDSFNATEAAE